MSSSAKNPIVIESDDEEEEVVYMGTTQGAPKGQLVHTCEGSCEVVDVDELEPYVIDVEEQPDSQGFPAPAGGSLEQDLGPLLDISQSNMARANSPVNALLTSDDLDLSSLGSTDPLASLNPGSFSLNSTTIDLDSSTIAGHGSSAMGIVSCQTSGRTDLAHTSHGPADLTNDLIDTSISSSSGSHVDGTGCDLAMTTLIGDAGQSFNASNVLQAQNSGAPLTSTDSSGQGFGAASLSYNPLAHGFSSQSDAPYSGSSSHDQSLQSQDANSALDLRQQAVDLSIPRTDLNSLSSSNKSLDQSFPDSMTIFPSFYMDDDMVQPPSLLGGRTMDGTSGPDDSKSLLDVKGDLQCQPVTSGSPPPLVSVTTSLSVSPPQNLPMATNATCPQATPVSAVPNPAQWQTGLVTDLVSSDGHASDKVVMSSTSSALPLLMQSSVAQSGTQTAAGQQSTSPSQFGLLNPGPFQPAVSVQVDNAQVPALQSYGSIMCSGFGSMASGPSMASSLPGSCTLVAPAVAQGSASSAGFLSDVTKTTTVAHDPVSSVPGVILSNSGSGSVQMSPVVSDSMVVLSSAGAASTSLPVGMLAMPLGSTTYSQASGISSPVGIGAQPPLQPLLVYPSQQPASSSPKWGSPAIGQNSAVISPPSLSTSTSSSTGPSAASVAVTNASTSGHNSATDASGSMGAPPLDPSFGYSSGFLNSIGNGDVLEKALQGLWGGPDKSSSGTSSTTGQSSGVSSTSGAGLLDVATSVADPSKSQGVDVPFSQSSARQAISHLNSTIRKFVQTASAYKIAKAAMSPLPAQPFSCVVAPASSAQLPPTSNPGNSSSSAGSSAGMLHSAGVSSLPFAVGMAISSLGLTSPSQGGSSHSYSMGTSSQQLSLSYAPMAAISLPPRKRKYTDTSQGSSSSGGPNPSKRPRGWERMLCAGCSVATEDRDRVLQCPFGHLACSTCLQRQNVLFLQNKVKKLSCFDVTCSYIFGNHTVWRLVGSQGDDKDTASGDDERGFVTSDVNKSLEVPIHWEAMKSEQKEKYKLVDLPPDSTEYKHVKAMFQKSLKFRIKKICRVQNMSLWRYYNMKKLDMTNDKQGNVDERLLFHGTKDSQVLQNICAKGFDWRYSGRHGTLYGHGSYFAVRADYSHQYCTPNRNRFRSPGLVYMAHQAHPLGSFSRLLSRNVLGRGPSLASFALAPTTSFQLLGTHSLVATPAQTLTQSSGLSRSLYGPVGSAAVGSSGSSGSGSSSSSSFMPQYPGTHPPKPASGSGGQGLGRLGASPLSSNDLSLLGHAVQIAKKHKRAVSAHLWSNNGLLGGNPWSALPGGSSSSASSSSAPSSSATSSSAPSSSSSSSQQSAPLGPLPPPPPPPPPDSTSTSEDKGPTLRMLLAKVLVGKFTRGTKEMRKPPPLSEDEPFGGDYDSCVDNLVEPTIHVVFDSKQTYPMWVIEYVEEYD